MAKLEPIVSWVDATTMLEYGAVGAPAAMRFSSSADKYQSILTGTDSVPLQFCICNNFKKGEQQTSDCYDLVDCRLTVKSAAGDFESPIVKERWIRAKCDSMQDVDFTPLGSHTSEDAEVEDAIFISSTKETPKTIAGTANDGDEAVGAKNNVCKITAIMNPPRTTKAPATANTGMFRLIYSYGEGVTPTV